MRVSTAPPEPSTCGTSCGSTSPTASNWSEASPPDRTPDSGTIVKSIWSRYASPGFSETSDGHAYPSRRTIVAPWSCVYFSSSNGPEPTTSPWSRAAGSVVAVASDRIASDTVEVACRNCALGVAKATVTVCSSSTVVPW